jgi:hypothetical protein
MKRPAKKTSSVQSTRLKVSWGSRRATMKRGDRAGHGGVAEVGAGEERDDDAGEDDEDGDRGAWERHGG